MGTETAGKVSVIARAAQGEGSQGSPQAMRFAKEDASAVALNTIRQIKGVSCPVATEENLKGAIWLGGAGRRHTVAGQAYVRDVDQTLEAVAYDVAEFGVHPLPLGQRRNLADHADTAHELSPFGGAVAMVRRTVRNASSG